MSRARWGRPNLLLTLRAFRFRPGGLTEQALQLVFDYTEAIFRPAVWCACQNANVPYSPPSRLRLAGLRDHGEQLRRRDAGFLGQYAFEQAKRIAQSLETEE
ncbi:hypothetical protein [Deinococcus metallilatus]|uniref:hypothetical protein n=1 Tax=Deinococcus metallilatus TaxID=1211322 RepID=UPI0014859748|nr:hypothetical protein [Deinococcus metallilatus]GMA15416.1 hypothetical protein GCM10025871_17470 [Deinococcus metallilatus]